MGFTPFSTIVAPSSFEQPIPTQLLYAGAQAKEARAQNNLHQIQGQIQNIMNIPAINDADAQVLKQKQEEFKQKLAGVSNEDLSSPQSMAKINEITSAFANDNDVLAVAHRGHSYQQMLADKKTAEAKGENYYNAGLDDAQDYIQGNTYLKDKRFNNLGGVAPDILKAQKELIAEIPKKKSVITDANGQDHTIEYTDPSDISAAMKQYWTTDPKARQYGEYMFNKQYKGADWNTEAEKHLTALNSHLNDSLETIKAHYNLPGISEDKKKELELEAQNIQARQGQLAQALTSGYKGAMAQQIAKDAFINQQSDDFANTHDLFNTSNLDINKNYKLQKEFAHDFAKEKYQSDLKQIEEQYKDIVSGANSLGYTPAELLASPEKRQVAKVESERIKNEEEQAKEDRKLDSYSKRLEIKNGKTTGNTSEIHPDLEQFHTVTKFADKNPGEFVPDPKDPSKPNSVKLDEGIFSDLNLGTSIEGWHQLKSDAFLQKWMNFKKIGLPNGDIQPIYENGRPAVYTKDGNMVVKVKAGGSAGKGDEYLIVDSKELYSSLYNQTTDKGRAKLSVNKEANISGNYGDVASSVTNPQLPAIPNPQSHAHAFSNGQDTVYSNDGKVWYDKNGKIVK